MTIFEGLKKSFMLADRYSTKTPIIFNPATCNSIIVAHQLELTYDRHFVFETLLLISVWPDAIIIVINTTQQASIGKWYNFDEVEHHVT
jgi:hypothetical protein